MPVRIQFRRGTAAQWTSANPTLVAGEMGLETDTNKFKIGDGTTAWASLAYSSLPADAVSANTIDAKGDLFVGTSDNTVGRQAVGANGKILMANSGTATGVAWTGVEDDQIILGTSIFS